MQTGTEPNATAPQDSFPANYDPQGQQDSDPGESFKSQKSRHRAKCVIKNDDERRRPISRAYVTTLTDRVSMLETMLKDRGAEPPTVQYPPKTTRGTFHADGDHSPVRSSVQQQQQQQTSSQAAVPEKASPESLPEDGTDGSHMSSAMSVEGQRDGNDLAASHSTPIEDKNQGLVSRLLSTRGHLSFDQLSGRLRYFGPTVNSHIYSEPTVDDTKQSREALEQARRAEKIIRTLPLETHDHLMQMFFHHYNGVLHVVHEEAFNEDRENGKTQFYSGFLHICILAMGYRFADKSRPDMQRIALPDRESTLHREAKYMLDLELERPGGIPSVAALLILGDSEVGVGRDNVGWMYAGMAMRLAVDIGLHLDSSHTGMAEREIDIRRMTLWACVIYDRYWSLFLGRPTTMKSADLEIYSLSNRFERLGTCKPAGPERSLNTRIYEALIDLMEIAGKIVENAEHRKHAETLQNPDQSAYFRMAAIDRELHNWAARLPQNLRYTEENRAFAPYSFYLLHQQYHAVLILLHRPFARYDDSSSPDAEDPSISALDSHFSKASRAICTKSAVAMSRIFLAHRQRFDGKQIFCIGMQHAGTAATALIAALAYIPDTADRTNNLQYLEVLHAALQDMSHGYQPAERMAAVLNAVVMELRGGPISPGKTLAPSTTSSIPARRGSSAIDAGIERPTFKRRQTSRSSKANKPMNPPSTVMSQHRASDASDRHSVVSLAMGQQSDAVMITPRSTEGSSSGWPHVHPNDNTFEPSTMFPTPETANLVSSSPVRHNAWMHNNNHLTNNDFSSLISMGGLPGMPDSDIGLDFLTLPSEDDWSRWHNGSADPAADLDGFPARGSAQMHVFQSPPMGGIMNG
ncbi:hypothetical protein B0A54_10577 [Friedmanniomyces endolithicus]|uniref:Xylanolytic transcriptional activator regulatory domain-containing protein n=1 Tax=Friedmanniomyces endolithicus TaxID=329885 RepID=A0A4U0UQ47_9PEZI|nr:hypothetical protein B0A54_10577 [Friedmanniomyces endolithicus]